MRVIRGSDISETCRGYPLKPDQAQPKTGDSQENGTPAALKKTRMKGRGTHAGHGAKAHDLLLNQTRAIE
ncbi:MAG: hypothetical protein CME36_12035 [unclassified Hahellaceae]|nr:hypothetical protein [Hahellaceae bacterium]